MMTNLLRSAFVANKLFSTIARLRLLLVMFVTLSVSAEVWGASIEINYGSSTTGWTIKDKGWSTKYWGLCNKTEYCIISPNFDDLSVITSVKVTTRTYGNTSNNSNKIGVYANATRIGTQQTATSTFTEYTFTPNDLSGNGAITIQSDGTTTGAGLRVTKVTIEYNDSPKDPCTITYEASLGNPDKTSEETTSSVTLPNISSIDCGDWEFAGWATARIEETNETPDPLYVAGSTYTPSSDITLYAVYKRTENGGNGGSSTEVTFNFGFKDWGKNATFSGTTYNEVEQNKDDVSVTYTRNDGSLYANTTSIRLYKTNTLTFDAGTNTITAISFTGSIGQNDITTNAGTCTNSTNTLSWAGSSKSVTFTRPSNASSYATLTSATLTIGGGSTTYYHSTPSCTTETTVFVIPKCGGDGGGTWLVVIEWFATF